MGAFRSGECACSKLLGGPFPHEPEGGSNALSSGRIEHQDSELLVCYLAALSREAHISPHLFSVPLALCSALIALTPRLARIAVSPSMSRVERPVSALASCVLVGERRGAAKRAPAISQHNTRARRSLCAPCNYTPRASTLTASQGLDPSGQCVSWLLRERGCSKPNHQHRSSAATLSTTPRSARSCACSRSTAPSSAST